MVFALINAGFLLYSMNAVAQSATIGSNAIAALGNDPSADITGIQRMAAAGLGTTALVNVTEIDVIELANDANGGFQVDANGNPVVQGGCTARGQSAGIGGYAADACVDRYTFTVSGGNTTVTALDAGNPCASASLCPPWMPETRVVTNGNDPQGNGCSYVGLKVQYRYNFKGAPAGGLTLTTLKTFRLEPQT